MARIDRTERLLNVVFCLLGAARPVSRSEIRRLVAGYGADASDAAFERMFERDKDELRGMGIPVETVVDVNGEVEGYLIRRQNATSDLEFNADELALLALAAAVSQEAILEASATTALRKIETISGDAPDLLNQVSMRLGATDAALLPLMTALREQCVVSFAYQGRNDVQSEKRIVDPWGVIAHDGSWYFIGHDHDRGARRTFRISRIQGTVTVTARPIETARHRDLNLVDVVRGETPEVRSTARVVIAAGHGAALRIGNHCDDSPFDEVELLVSAVTDELLISQICAAGTGVRVIEPNHIRDRVMQVLREIADLHGAIS